jgi:hypothetical protein
MGQAPKIKADLKATRDQEWVLDPATGQIKPERDPEDESTRLTPQPAPVQSASYTYD